MSTITVKSKGNFNKTKRFFSKATNIFDMSKLIRIADRTVTRLKEASPSESIARGWGYEINKKRNGVQILFTNSEIQNGTNIAILVDSGHVSKGGKWVSGKNFIEKPIQEAYDEIIKDTWEELKDYE